MFLFEGLFHAFKYVTLEVCSLMEKESEKGKGEIGKG